MRFLLCSSSDVGGSCLYQTLPNQKRKVSPAQLSTVLFADHKHRGFSLDIFVVDSTHPDVGALLMFNSTCEKKTRHRRSLGAGQVFSHRIGHFCFESKATAVFLLSRRAGKICIAVHSLSSLRAVNRCCVDQPFLTAVCVWFVFAVAVFVCYVPYFPLFFFGVG